MSEIAETLQGMKEQLQKLIYNQFLVFRNIKENDVLEFVRLAGTKG